MPQITVFGGFVVSCWSFVRVRDGAADDVAGVAPVGGCPSVPGVEDSAVEFCSGDGLSSRNRECSPCCFEYVAVVRDQEQGDSRGGLVRRRNWGGGWAGPVPRG